jgi:YebC/PmpR family DNA-binding regulatory protein
MPKDNIDRAIQRGAGGDDGANIEEIRYEGYGQAGVAILVDCMTDNRNRSVSDVRYAFNKGGGSMGESGCVAWMFHQKGQLIFELDGIDGDALMEAAMDAGAEDIIEQDDGLSIEVETNLSDFLTVQEILEKSGFHTVMAEITWIPENTVEVEGEPAEKLLRLIERLEDIDDVQGVFTNYDIADSEMERIQAL